MQKRICGVDVQIWGGLVFGKLVLVTVLLGDLGEAAGAGLGGWAKGLQARPCNAGGKAVRGGPGLEALTHWRAAYNKIIIFAATKSNDLKLQN